MIQPGMSGTTVAADPPAPAVRLPRRRGIEFTLIVLAVLLYFLLDIVSLGRQALDDFLLIYDELNDNIDTYIDRKNDIRKPLRLIVDADTEFQARLRALKDAADVAPEEAKQYEFVLTNTLDTLDTSAVDHRKLLTEQEEAGKHKKKFEKASGGKAE